MTDQELDVELSDVSIDDLLQSKLVVFNDDHNSFEWVMECFQKYLHIGTEQAEQLAIIIHNKGKASVKNGRKEDLEPICTAFTDAGLSAEIQ